MRDYDEQVQRAALALRSRLPETLPEVLVTLGSGLTAVADRLVDPVRIPVGVIPGLPVSRVPGHPGELRYGRLADVPVLVQVGRAHLYEGYTAAECARIVDVAAELGVRRIIVTAAAGAVVERYVPGQLVLLADQLNLTGTSPLVGVIRDGGPVFVDLSEPYAAALLEIATEVAEERGIGVRTGVYAGLLGPAYETPAEITMLRTLGADLVGMSVVHEVIAAKARGMEVLGVAVVTNVHDGRPTGHVDVLEVASSAAGAVADLIEGVLGRLRGER